MWNQIAMDKRRVYPSDLNDAKWNLIESLIPKPERKGPKDNVDVREVVNSIFYFLHQGCQWRALSSSAFRLHNEGEN